ncbi:MAG TPA: hypothetical protein O0X71_01565, partial [Methanocorpusculum sp.]|nr:hypothetical protein [Methanocorpusculum sp.]
MQGKGNAGTVYKIRNDPATIIFQHKKARKEDYASSFSVTAGIFGISMCFPIRLSFFSNAS